MRKVAQVQFPMIFETSIGPADVNSTVEIDVPPNFVLTGTTIAVRTVFDGTTPTVGVTDNKTVPTTIIASGTVLTAVAATSSSAANFTKYPNGGTIIVSPVNAGGTTTVGDAGVMLQGYVEGRQNELFRG